MGRSVVYKWLAAANGIALGVFALSWMLPYGIAMPQGGVELDQWHLFLLAMQFRPWQLTVPLVLCLDVIMLALLPKHS